MSEDTIPEVSSLQDESPTASAASVLPILSGIVTEPHCDLPAGHVVDAADILPSLSRAPRSPVAPAGASGLLTVSQVAALLGVSSQRVRQMIASGQLKARKINPRLFLVRRGDVKYVARRPLGRPRG